MKVLQVCHAICPGRGSELGFSWNWATRLSRNSTYTIHPEEVLADNLALLVRRRLGATAAPTDVDFFARFEALLTDHV